MHRLRSPLSLIAAGMLVVSVTTSPLLAQNTVPNPLRPSTEPEQRARPPAADRTAEPERKAEAQKPKRTRERSAKQKQNDDMMRACGTEWRAEKAALQAKGETWRSFLKDCRAKKKNEVPA
jgi:hypothetical protein